MKTATALENAILASLVNEMLSGSDAFSTLLTHAIGGSISRVLGSLICNAREFVASLIDRDVIKIIFGSEGLDIWVVPEWGQRIINHINRTFALCATANCKLIFRHCF